MGAGTRASFGSLVPVVTCNQGMYPQESALFGAVMRSTRKHPGLNGAFRSLDVSMLRLADEATGCVAIRGSSAVKFEDSGGEPRAMLDSDQCYVCRLTFEWGDEPLPLLFTREELHVSQQVSSAEPPEVADLTTLLAQHKRR